MDKSSSVEDVDLESVRELYRRERERRLRKDGNVQFPDLEGDLARFAADPLADSSYTRDARTFDADAVIIGGGMSGLLAGAQMRKGGLTRICIIEKGTDFGGTWYWNRYPGAQCDVESYIYLPMLEELGYIPSERYAHQPEISSHLRKIAEHFGLYEDALRQTEATTMVWEEDTQRWRINTNRGDDISARYLVVAPGDQHTPRLPAIPGVETFTGHTFHTSRWDYEYTGENLENLADKRVGVIGTGATGLQVVPKVAAAAGHLFVLQRTPSTVSVRDNRPTDPSWAGELRPGWQRERMENFTGFIFSGYENDIVQDGWTKTYRRLNSPLMAGESIDSPAAEKADLEVMEDVRRRVDEIVQDPTVAQALKPYYRYSCKRPGFHDEYLASFNRPNVTLVDTQGHGVDRFVPTGVVVGDEVLELDCVIFATGFDVGSGYAHAHPFHLEGRDHELIAKKWADGLHTFHGMHTRSFPNCFFLGVTQTGVSTNFAHSLVEQAEHVGYIVREAEKRGVVVEASEAAEEQWVDTIVNGTTEAMRRFQESCTPGYFNNEGNPDDRKKFLAGRYPAGPVAFFKLLREWREEGQLSGLELTARKN